jgi:tetratricopeptide (TPR) repeat protein
MKTAKHILYCVLLNSLVLVAVALINPHQGAAAWDHRELPASAKLVLIEVRDLMNQKDYARAISKIEAFQDRAGRAATNALDAEGCRHPMVYFALGNCCLLKEDYVGAKKALIAAVDREPTFADAWVNLAKTYYELKEYAEAAKCYAHAYEGSDQTHPEYLYFSAAGYLMAEKYEPALMAFQRLFKEHAGRIQQQWKENYVTALLSAGYPRRAVPLIRSLAEQSKGENQIRWQETLIHFYLQLDMHGQALSYVTGLTRENCIMAKWWRALTHVNLSLGHYREALAALTIYGYLTPLSPDEQKLWADLNLQLNIPVKAVAVYEAMMQERPDKRLLQKLVMAYQKLDRSEKALEQLNHLGSENNDPEFWMLKGDLFYAMKRFNDANNAYRRAAQAGFREAGRAWLLAGYSAWQIKDLKASRYAFENASKYSGQQKAARLAMAQLGKTE